MYSNVIASNADGNPTMVTIFGNRYARFFGFVLDCHRHASATFDFPCVCLCCSAFVAMQIGVYCLLQQSTVEMIMSFRQARSWRKKCCGSNGSSNTQESATTSWFRWSQLSMILHSSLSQLGDRIRRKQKFWK